MKYLEEIEHPPIEHDYRSPETIKRQKESMGCKRKGNCGCYIYDPRTRFFANGKYATGEFKKWLDKAMKNFDQKAANKQKDKWCTQTTPKE